MVLRTFPYSHPTVAKVSLNRTLINSALVSFGALAGFSIGIWATVPAKIDGGIASLLGAAIGSGITVAGAFYVARAGEGMRQSAEIELVAGNLSYIVAKCAEISVLKDDFDAENFEDFDVIGERLLTLAQALFNAIGHFERLSPFDEIKNYRIRLMLSELLGSMTEHKAVVDKETRWLGNRLTLAVVTNSFDDLGLAAGEIAGAIEGRAGELREHAR